MIDKEGAMKIKILSEKKGKRIRRLPASPGTHATQSAGFFAHQRSLGTSNWLSGQESWTPSKASFKSASKRRCRTDCRRPCWRERSQALGLRGQ